MQETLARPRWDINHVLAYGQSLSNGCEGWPALSRVQPFDNLMLGESVRPREDGGMHWQPVGAARFTPLTATVQHPATGALLAPEAVASLPRNAVVFGETVLEGALNFWRAALLRDGHATPGRARLLASSCGVGAKTLEALSKGAAPEFFARLRDCVRLARATAAAAGQSYGITALLFLQGEHNSWALNGGTSDRGAYLSLLRQLHRDCLADLARDIAGQRETLAFLLYQTGGTYASETLSVAQAQLEFALATPGCFMAAPSYPVTEKGGHLDANGYRWLGAQFGKVLHRVVTLGQDWRPLHPLSAIGRGTTVAVHFHVPVPPLRFGRPCAVQRLVDVRDHGFGVVDRRGEVPLRGVEISGPATLRLVLEREPDGAALLRYADKAHGGRGSLHDSDDEPALDRYEYEAATGHNPEADIAALVGRPYPLQNWCVAFTLPVVAAIDEPDITAAPPD